MRTLSVWMNGEQVGFWNQGRGGLHTFKYVETWLKSPYCRALSLSIPIISNGSISGKVVSNYFDNLLPDNTRIRRRLQDLHKTKSIEAFDLLEQIGRDCIGAVQLLPENETPTNWNKLQFDVLDEVNVAQILRDTPTNQDFLERTRKDYRISLAGAQEKTALLKFNGKWCLPKGATPTSHIFKLPMGMIGGQSLDWKHSIENEWLCLKILDALGLPVANAEIGQFEDQNTLIIERFDRRWMNEDNPAKTWLARLPQEDFCQALGIPPYLKYESDGGPGIDSCLTVLRKSQNAVLDVQLFLLSQFSFWLLGAIDGHAKNFSIRLGSQDHYELTPLYDVLSIWPLIGKGAKQLHMNKAKMAMAVRSRNAHYQIQEIQTRHWQHLCEKHGQGNTWSLFLELSDKVDAAICKVEQLLPESFPMQIADKIFENVRQQKNKFLNGLKI